MNELQILFSGYNPIIKDLSDKNNKRFYITLTKKSSGKRDAFLRWLTSLIDVPFDLSTYHTDGKIIYFILDYLEAI